MVVKHRSISDSYINTLHADDKLNLPYGGRLSSGNNSSQPAVSPSFLESQTKTNGPKTRTLTSIVSTLVKISFSVAAFYCIYSMRQILKIKDNELLTIRRDFDYIEEALTITQAEVNRARTSLVNLQSQFGNLLPGSPKSMGPEWEGTFTKIVGRQNAMTGRIRDLQHTIATMHRREAIEHFGVGLYHLQFNVLIDDSEFSFIVEMAPIDMMPHSVNYVLEMIKAKIWDNSVFTHRSNHILFAELRDDKGNDKRHLLSENNISTLSFPEYNTDYPHTKYTLGFSGRPGGPEFYINVEDNTSSHGPGGQAHHAMHEEADACFGRVIKGQHIVDWMQDRRKGHEGRLEEISTVIGSIRIIKYPETNA